MSKNQITQNEKEQDTELEKQIKLLSQKNQYSKIKKFYCTICKKSFSTNGNLKNHINTIHNHILPFKCPFPLCTHSYSNQSRLSIHLRTHSGLKPFICPICKKSFNEKGNLKTHIGFHSEERPFKCNQCDKSYKTNGHLKDHIETHHFNLKKFVCCICQCKFGRRSTLSSHMKIHIGNFKNGNVIFQSNKDIDNIYKEDKNNNINENNIIDNKINNNNNNFINVDHIFKKDIIENNNKNFYEYLNNNFDIMNFDKNVFENNQNINEKKINENIININLFPNPSTLFENDKYINEINNYKLNEHLLNFFSNENINNNYRNQFEQIMKINKFINDYFLFQQMYNGNLDKM